MAQKAKAKEKRGRGRPSKFNGEIVRKICDGLSSGRTLRDTCRDEGMPAPSTIILWTQQDRKFAEQYARAREAGYRQMAEEILDISDDGTNDYVERERENGTKHVVFDGEHVQRSRLRVDTRKWLLSKALPKVYGDRLVTELTGKDGGPIKTEAAVILDASKLDADARGLLREALKAAKG